MDKEVAVKICRDCKIEKDSDAFYKTMYGKLKSYCIECQRERERATRKKYKPKKSKVITFSGDIPKCTNHEDYQAWKELARIGGALPAGFCTDCTKEYQTTMIHARRCEQPLVMFRRTKEGFVDGYLPKDDEPLESVLT